MYTPTAMYAPSALAMADRVHRIGRSTAPIDEDLTAVSLDYLNGSRLSHLSTTL
jgi:hypothetical protein